MLHIKETYFGTFPEFRETIPQIDKPNTGNRAFRGQVSVLESAEVKKRRADVKAELGLDKDLNAIVVSESKTEESVVDRKYFNEISNLYQLSEL